MDIAFLVGRLLFGGFFVMMGANHFTKAKMLTGYAASKKVPLAQLLVLVSGALMLGGGLGIILGAYITWSVAALVFFLVPAAFKMHDFWAFADPNEKMTQMLFFLRNIALTGAALMLLAIPQPWSPGLGL